MVLVSMTEPDGASIAAERIRSTVAGPALVVFRHHIPATISIGVAISNDDGRDGLIERADAALYLAKETGRNQVVYAEPLPAHVLPA